MAFPQVFDSIRTDCKGHVKLYTEGSGWWVASLRDFSAAVENDKEDTDTMKSHGGYLSAKHLNPAAQSSPYLLCFEE